MSENLTFCPCCGNEDVRIMEKYYQSWTPLYYAVCTSCGMRTSEFREKEEAIKRWNKRVLSWIKTSEGLPKLEKDVLLCDGDDYYSVGYLRSDDDGNKNWEIDNGHYLSDFDEFGFWMSLPKPPEVI